MLQAPKSLQKCGRHKAALPARPHVHPPQVDNWQIISVDGRLENRVQLAPGVRVRALAGCAPEPAPGGGTRTGVAIEEVVVELGPLRLPLPVKTDARGFVEWDYLDGDFRISRGSKGSTFIHVREA